MFTDLIITQTVAGFFSVSPLLRLMYYRHVIKTLRIITVLLALTSSFMVAAPEVSAKSYTSCTKLRRVYPNGIAKSRLSAGSSKAKISSSIYRQNRKFDIDNDGIACEKSQPSVPSTSVSTTSVPSTSVSTTSRRLGDLCAKAMLSAFVEIQVRLTDRNYDLDKYIVGFGVVTRRTVERTWVKPSSDSRVAEGIEIEVMNICGTTGGQNSPRASSRPGMRTSIYSYGGDAMVIGDVQLNDVVVYTNAGMGYAFGLIARPLDSSQVLAAISKY